MHTTRTFTRGARRVGGTALFLSTAAAIVAAPAAPAAAAGPTNVARSGTTVTVAAAAATANDVSVFLDENAELTVTDRSGIAEVPGDGCTVFFGNTAKCGTGVTLVSAFLGDGDDEIQLESPVELVIDGGVGNDTYFGGMARGGASRVTFRGGADRDTASYVNADRFVTVALDGTPSDGRPGDADNIAPDVENVVGTRFPDTLTGSEASNLLDGRSGPDTLRGLGGNDSFPEGEFATGADDLSGGVGRDAVFYSQRRAGVTVDLDDVADDGAAGELDNVRRDVEVVSSGTGNDVLVGNASANEFSSGGGSDRVEGRGGPDLLNADDDVAGFLAPDVVLGGAGDDRISVADEIRDDVRCGAGSADVAFIDGFDTVTACEQLGTL